MQNNCRKPMQPIKQPTYQPSTQPTYQPIRQPSTQPSYQPIRQPSYQPPTQPTYQPNQAQIFVDGHNSYRNNVCPVATNMKPIVWSDDLAEQASQWAAKCTWQHSGTPGVGENLYLTSKQYTDSSDFDPMEAINSWGSELNCYDYDNNSCGGSITKGCNPVAGNNCDNQVCGHYTQMVWANSDNVGCVVQSCPSISNSPGIKKGTLVVCQYQPPGNYIGQKPYRS